MQKELTNWARNYAYKAATVHAPTTVEQVQELVSRGRKLKALGSRHSFNEIADTEGDLIALDKLNRVLGIDRQTSTVRIEAGIKYGELCGYLDREGFALRNMASLPHISVAGACATGTHGSGVANGNLSTSVSEMEVVTADGTLATFSRERDAEQFDGAVVGLGALGVVIRLTLRVVPAFTMSQLIYEQLPFSQVEQNFEAIMSSAYSVSLFTDWQSDLINQLWIKRVHSDELTAEPEAIFFGAQLATGPRHPIHGMPVENCTEQMGVPGPWHERLPHFRMEFTPSSGEELQTEYLVPRTQAPAALRAVYGLKDKIAPLLQISEVRTVAADSLWMSPSYQRNSAAIHFTWKKNWPEVEKLLPQIEERLAPFEARPHWAKLFTMSPGRLYAKLPDFRTMMQTYDPQGKFRNAFLDRWIF